MPEAAGRNIGGGEEGSIIELREPGVLGTLSDGAIDGDPGLDGEWSCKLCNRECKADAERFSLSNTGAKFSVDIFRL